jgi:hypothetical protein
MRFRHWYWIFVFVLFTNTAIVAFSTGLVGQIAFGYIFVALALHSVWMLMTAHPTIFEREYWDSIKRGLGGDE